MKLAVLLIAVFLTGCQDPHPIPVGIRFAFPAVVFRGPYAAQLTVDDVRQIVRIAKGRSDIAKPIDLITADKPDHASVKAGDARKSGDQVSTFEVHKEGGRWRLIEGSVYTTRETIVTG